MKTMSNPDSGTENLPDMTAEQAVQEASYYFPYHYLGLISDEYRLMLHVEYVSRLQIVKNLLKPFEGQRILDAGCGDGRFCYELRKENVEVIGIDFSEHALNFARAFCPGMSFFVQDLKDTKVPGQFDVVVFIETLEHIIPVDIPTVLEGLANMLKPGGKLIVTVPSVNIPLVSKHYQHFTPQSLKDTLTDLFEVREIIGHNRTFCPSFLARIFYGRFRTLGRWLFPFRHYRIVTKLYERLNAFYNSELAIGAPDDCYGLIAVCRKR